MKVKALRSLLEDVRAGTISRRAFTERLMARGLGLATVASLLEHAGIAHAQASPAFQYAPKSRGGGGTLRILSWQGPTLLNPHFASGLKDNEACRLFYEPLADIDDEGRLFPVLAASIPSRANGGISADGRVQTWKLKPGVTWHDGKPFTADDCVFNWQYASDPGTAAVTIAGFNVYQVRKVDALTIQVVFDKPSPVLQTGMATGLLVPRHVFAPYSGTRSRDAPANGMPVGTGPYRCTDFKPGDLVKGVLNPQYHMPLRPHFDAVEIKGGGDATSAARAILQTGDYDFGSSINVPDDVLKRIEAGGKGRVVMTASANVAFVDLNLTDPWNEVEGERAHAKSRHFAFADLRVRQAMALLVDRKSIQEYVYGRQALATANFLNGPPNVRSPNNKVEFDIDKANALLDAAGWKRGSDGMRARDGRKMKFVFQGAASEVTQKLQTIIKSACGKAGIDIEIKPVAASVMFSSDVGNPDTATKFWSDMQTQALFVGSPEPDWLMGRFLKSELPSRANKWQGRNTSRWHSDAYDALHREALSEMDPLKRAALFIRMNDMVVREVATIPMMFRLFVCAVGNGIRAPLSAWSTLAHIHDWYRA